MTIGQAFDQTVALYPEGEALVVRHQQQRYNWAQLARAMIWHASCACSTCVYVMY